MLDSVALLWIEFFQAGRWHERESFTDQDSTESRFLFCSQRGRQSFRVFKHTPGVINSETRCFSLPRHWQKRPRNKGFTGIEGAEMKRIVASLFIVAAMSAQPVFAAGGASHLCEKGMKICACGKLPGALWNCCHAQAKCDCSAGLPNCSH